MPGSRPRSPLAMVVLAFLLEEPMHPYLMRQRVQERGKQRVANLAQPNSVYQAMDALHRQGLIRVRETSRQERRPERTVYEITEEGEQTLWQWLATMLSDPGRDFPDFPAAVSVLMLLDPLEAARLLDARVEGLRKRREELATEGGPLPRLFQLEDEYQRAMIDAEIDWVRSLVEDLLSGRLTWSREWIQAVGHMMGEQPDA
jgi:DNA-binding PadR family transcriptional regulator